MKSLLFYAFMLWAVLSAKAQNSPFNLYLEPLNIPELGGLQAYAFGQHEGKWLVFGGRLDGLHRRQPFATFDIAGHNLDILVVDPVMKKKWSAPLSTLPVSIREQLSSTNMEFDQDGNFLYIVGGYGYSNTAGDHVTYDKLTAVDVPGVIHAIVNGAPYAAYFRQISNPDFAITGGHLSKMYDTYYLTGGQKFMGRYNPMGPTHGPGFIQEYSDQVRRFHILDNGTSLTATILPPFSDPEQLHRRDYNVVPQIMPNEEQGITAFSGVFQKTVDLPYLNCVNIDSSGFKVQEGFTQYYNHYHCAFLPLYSENSREMHSVFFGGIAQFYDSLGVLVQDNNCPFVKTIARVTRTANGDMAEYKLPVKMPALLGASSEFIPLEGIPSFENDVIKLDELSADTTLVGYIYGGIASTAQNIFWINSGTESSASSQIFKVYVVRTASSGVHDLNVQSKGSLNLQVFPNPGNGQFSLKFQLQTKQSVKLSIRDEKGTLLLHETLPSLPVGENIIARKIDSLGVGKAYFVSLETAQERATIKTIIQE